MTRRYTLRPKYIKALISGESSPGGEGGGGGHSLVNVLPTRVHQPIKWTLNGVSHHVTFTPLNGVTPANIYLTLNGVFQLLQSEFRLGLYANLISCPIAQCSENMQTWFNSGAATKMADLLKGRYMFNDINASNWRTTNQISPKQ